MAKKKKKIVSKTEKKLKNQRRYQIEKRNKQRKKLNEAVKQLEKLTPEKKGKNLIYTIPNKIKNQLGIKRKVYKASKQTLINAYYQSIYKINNRVDELEQKLIKRFKFKQKGAITEKKRQKGELIFEMGFVWNVDENIPLVALNNPEIISINNLNIKTQTPEVIQEIQDEKAKMSSKHFMFLIGKPESNFRIYIENLDEKPRKLNKLRNKFST